MKKSEKKISGRSCLQSDNSENEIIAKSTDNFCEMSTIIYSMFEQVEAAHKLDGMKNASES